MSQPSAETGSFENSYDAPPRRKGRVKRWVITILVLLGVVIVLAGIKAIQIKTMIAAGAAMVPPPESVSSAQVQKVEWADTTPAVASLVAFRGVTLGAEVSGTVREIDFENGATVKKGAVLVKLDDSSEQAQLASARAEASLAKLGLDRAERLFKQSVSAQSDLDTARVRDEQAKAAVANLEAIIAKKVVRAPFDGRLGIRAVELGQVVSPGAPIVSLNTVTPIYAEFQLPQQALNDVKVGQKVQLTVDVFPKATWDGTITVINPEVDPSTRNVRMRATFANTDGRLAPGMFGNVSVVANTKQERLIVPATSVVYAPYGDSVFVISPDPKAKAGEKSLVAQQRFVRLGDRRGDFVVVSSGLEGNETVVRDGAFKLHNGQNVVIHNENVANPQLAPTPENE